MTASLPADVQAVFERFVTSELTTVDPEGQPITWPVTTFYRPGAPVIEVTTGLGYPQKADDARGHPSVSLLFSDPAGSGLRDAPMVLVQGSADVDDRDLRANAERYAHDRHEKAGSRVLPSPLRGRMPSLASRIYLHIRPERVYVWPRGEPDREPTLYDAHMEEVRSGHSEEPARLHAPPRGGPSVWDGRIADLGTRYPSVVLSVISPDGFPFAVRVRVGLDPAARFIEILHPTDALPLEPGRACLTAHTHDERARWQDNLEVRGDLVPAGEKWLFVPHRIGGGIDGPRSPLARLRAGAGRAWRARRVARRELARRSP